MAITAAGRRRLEALIALSRDPGATEAERRLAAEHAAKMGAGTAGPDPEYVYVECSSELVEALDRAMARASTVRDSRHRAARVRAAQHRLGRQATRQWMDGRGPALRG